MPTELNATMLQTLMEMSGINCRLVPAEEPDIDKDTVEIGDSAFVEIYPGHFNVWEQGEDCKFKITHQAFRYQEVIDLFSGQ
jgi:hypothetical protein